MGVDARMLVQCVDLMSDEALIQSSYRLAEAVGSDTFWLSNDETLARGEVRRALNRVTGNDPELEYHAAGVAATDGRWLWVSLKGRYYGPSYERGDIWRYIAIAEWLDHNILGCRVFYGGDSGEDLELFNVGERQRIIVHWAQYGHRPYYAGEGRQTSWSMLHEKPEPPMCQLCEHPATRYGSGARFASWTCDGCYRHWVWVGRKIQAFDCSRDFDPFAASKQMREAESEDL